MVGHRAVYVHRSTKFSQCIPRRRLKFVLDGFFSGQFDMLNWHRSSSDHSDWLFSWRTSAQKKRRTDVLLGRRVSSVGLVCQGKFGPRRCQCESTLPSAFVATSSSALDWCAPGLTWPISHLDSRRSVWQHNMNTISIFWCKYIHSLKKRCFMMP